MNDQQSVGLALFSMFLTFALLPLVTALQMHWAFGVEVQSWPGLFVCTFLALVVGVLAKLLVGSDK